MSHPLRSMDGVSIGHSTRHDIESGCTVLLFDRPALTAVDVRGAAPGTRELDVLAPGRAVQRADAILLSGGSAFGLRAADGVVQELAARGRGYPTPTGPVPIVPTAVIYDLAAGKPVAPEVADGREAITSAVGLETVEQGQVGAGTGATWGHISPQGARKGGVGIAQIEPGGALVTAIVVLNAFGALDGDFRETILQNSTIPSGPGQATTLIAVVTNAACTHDDLTRMCVAAHDALARLVVPSHTLLDGDVAFASTVTEGATESSASLRLCMATELAVEEAIRRAAGLGRLGEANQLPDRSASGATLETLPQPGPV